MTSAGRRFPGITVGAREVTPDVVIRVAAGTRRVRLDPSAAWRRRVRASRAALERALGAGTPVYGVSTGVGNTSSRSIDPGRRTEFTWDLMRQHGCGVGEPFGEEEARAIVFCRLVSLAKGFSAVRLELLEGLCGLLNGGVLPVIPKIGSVGASGDLTPLSYVAAVLAGEREAFYGGRTLPAARALKKAGLAPIVFAPKETLAIMNGTSVMTALGILIVERLGRLVAVAEKSTALAAEVLEGRSQAFHPLVHAVKPHPGQVRSAANIRSALAGGRLLDPPQPPGRSIQDRYSVRCAPQILGAVRDCLDWARDVLRIELNSVNDNPLVDGENGRVLFGGNFYGGHVALAMDMIKLGASSVADMVDRQFALLVDTHHNMGLPETLVPYPGSGIKGLQITCSALTALAIQRSAPDSTLSRSTECDNQDKVSMGLNGALNAAEVLTLLARALATELIALSNGARFRDEARVSSRGRTLLAFVRRHSPVLRADRRLDRDISRLASALETGPGAP